MNKRQIEEAGKLCLDMGKLVFASFVLGLFQSELPMVLIIGLGLLGLTMAMTLFIMGLQLLKE
jgi:hypothetical protein